MSIHLSFLSYNLKLNMFSEIQIFKMNVPASENNFFVWMFTGSLIVSGFEEETVLE